MKGQSSLEFVSTVGIALVLAAPFVVQVQETMIDVSFSRDVSEFQSSFDDLGEAVRNVDSRGPPSKRVVNLTLNRDMKDFSVSEDRSIIYTMEYSGTTSNFTKIFDTQIHTENMPLDEGKYKLEVEAWQDQVNISR